MNVLSKSQSVYVEQLKAYQVDGGFHLHPAQARAEEQSKHPVSITFVNCAAWAHDETGLCELLQPIEDASHTRDRRRSPPDSACMAGTRLALVQNVNAWARSHIASGTEPHLRWMHGYVGSGKSAISQEVCDTSEREDRPVASFFFFRNAGDRSKIWRLATTLASQMAAVIPETEPFIRSAVRATRAVIRPDKGGVSLGSRMQRLVYAPFKAVVDAGTRVLARGPFLIVLDGLDECDDREEVQELIDGMLSFLDGNPFIPLRIFITSRVEQHIQSRLNVPRVQLDNLADHCSDKDIATFLDVLFEDGYRRNTVIQAYVRQHGQWPSPDDRRNLVQHIGGSFIFASAVFKFIMGLTDQGSSPTSTPMDRLPLALKMNPGLDGLYAQTLARSEHIPHFLDVISTIALLRAPLPTSGIAELLGINTYEVVNVLADLQAIIQVPGTDDIPVTLCHTSLRDFLTNRSRSGRFFAHPRHHVRLFLRCIECELSLRRQKPRVPIHPSGCTSAVAYALYYAMNHLSKGYPFFQESESDYAIQLRREALEFHPGTPGLVHALATIVHTRAVWTGSLTGREEAVALYHEALALRPLDDPDRSQSLNNLIISLQDLYKKTGTLPHLCGAIAHCEELLAVHYLPGHKYRIQTLNWLVSLLGALFDATGNEQDLDRIKRLKEEAYRLSASAPAI